MPINSLTGALTLDPNAVYTKGMSEDISYKEFAEKWSSTQIQESLSKFKEGQVKYIAKVYARDYTSQPWFGPYPSYEVAMSEVRRDSGFSDESILGVEVQILMPLTPLQRH